MANKPVHIGKTNQMILSGELDLSVWSDEELMRGQRRDKNGRWVGRPPKVVPKAVHDELVRRKMSKAHDLMRDNVVEATTVLVEIAKDPDVDPAVRLKAVGMIHDRVLGKAPEKVDLTIAEAPWQVAVQAGLVRIAPEVIDVE